MTIRIAARRLLLAVALVGAAAAAVVLWRVDPAAPGNPYPSCLFFAWTGSYCPGCGALRAFHRLLHGELLAALRMNALVPLLFPLLVFGVVQQAFPRLWPARAPERAPVGSLWALVALVVLFGVARNLPFAPFDRLAPEPAPAAARVDPAPPPDR